MKKLSITEFKYSYEYDEVTCFEHPLVISLDYLKSDTGHLFAILSKLRETYGTQKVENGYTNIRDSVLRTIQDYSGIEVNELRNLSYKEIIRQIDKGVPIIVGVNLKDIFYSSYYMERDWNHWFLIIGYKEKQRLVTILDNTQFHNIGEDYEEFNIPFDILKQANKSYVKKYGKQYSVIELANLSRVNEKKIMSLIIEEYCNLNLMKTDGYRQIVLLNTYLDVLKDISIEVGWENVNNVEIEGSITREIKKKIININKYRKIFFDEIKKYMENSGYKDTYSENVSKFEKQCSELNKIWQNYVINSFVKIAKVQNLENIVPNKIIDNEEIVQNEVKKFLVYLNEEKISKNTVSDKALINKNENFRYENNEDKIALNKMLGESSGEILFEFAGRRNYNYWDMDEAPRVVIDINRGENEIIEIYAESKTVYRNDVNVEVGLFIRDNDNGRVYMLGVENEESIVVSEIGVSGYKYEIDKKDGVRLFIRIKEKLVEFGVYKVNIDNNQEINRSEKINRDVIYSIDINSEMNSDVGIMCKTWGKIGKASVECKWWINKADNKLL